MKKLTFFIIFLILTSNLFAEKVEIEKAKTVAKNYYFLQHEQLKGIKIAKEDLMFSQAFEIEYESNLVFYIFNIENGFVIVSADDLVEPILGFSLENGYSDKDLPPALVDLLAHYKEQISYAIKEQIKSDEKILEKWEFLANIENLKDYGDCEIWPKYYSKSPLTTTHWGQRGRYNVLCPYDSIKQKRAPAGCAAVAMAQVMKFWNKPTQGTGSNSYRDGNNNPNSYYSSADFGETTYNWANMPNTVFGNINYDVATIIYHCGVSVNTDYGYAESGITGLDGVEDALEDNFNYYSSADYIVKSSYSNMNWDNILRNNLDTRKPIIYAGYDQSGDEGHAFVLDGYSKTIYETYSTYTCFHINWGWKGDYDGYFTLTDLTPDDFNYNYLQRAVVGIVHPNATYSTPPQPSSIQAACSTPYCMGETYEFSVSPIDLATEYEWEVTGYPCGAHVSNDLNYAFVYAIFPSTNTLRVRAKNGGTVGAWRIYPFVVTDCEYKKSTINSDANNDQQQKDLKQIEILENSDQLNEIQIFPNPATNILTIYLPNYETTEIKIFDVKGSLRKNVISKNSQLSINVKDLENGIYFISFISKQGIENRKIQILR